VFQAFPSVSFFDQLLPGLFRYFRTVFISINKNTFSFLKIRNSCAVTRCIAQKPQKIRSTVETTGNVSERLSHICDNKSKTDLNFFPRTYTVIRFYVPTITNSVLINQILINCSIIIGTIRKRKLEKNCFRNSTP